MNNSIFNNSQFGLGNSEDPKTDNTSETSSPTAAALAELRSHFAQLLADLPDDAEAHFAAEDESDDDDIFHIDPDRICTDEDEDEDEDNEDDSTSNMDSDDFHNKAVDIARNGRSREAAALCMKGLKKFPGNVDLLADTIQYSSDCGDMKTAAAHYAMLKEQVPFHRWNWRAFTFAFNYLLESDPVANEQECRTIVENYKRYLPYEEKAMVAASTLETTLGNAEAGMQVLMDAIRTYPNAPQCALRLADMQMDRGLFPDVVNTATYGLAASTEAQPSINVPYLLYLRTLAKDHLVCKRVNTGEPITQEELAELAEDYKLLKDEFPQLMPYMRTINTRSSVLKFIRPQ